ncbi:MAG: hypothetical protein NXI11_13965, partial [Proteobacteria bacterium]|nr:hypothetical protein [Pseudomonadota bacterium]
AQIFENGFDGLAGAFRDGIIDLASEVSGLSESLTSATLQNGGDIANAIDQANAAAMANAEIQASAILSPLRFLGIETGNMRAQLVEQFRQQILEQQLTSRLTDILGAETRDVQSLVSAAAQIISGDVTASGESIIKELFGLAQLEGTTAQQIAEAIRSGDLGLLGGLLDVERAVRDTSAFEASVLARFGDQFGGLINQLVQNARVPSQPAPSTPSGPTVGPGLSTGGIGSGFTPPTPGPTRAEVKELFDSVRATAFAAEQRRIAAEISTSGVFGAINTARAISQANDVALQAARDAVRQAYPNQTFFQFRHGGIARGPETGYNVELHGTEAVMPTVRMPDGNFGVRVAQQNSAELVRELQALRREVAELRTSQAEKTDALIRVEQAGWQRSLEQGEKQIKQGQRVARRSDLESA